MKALVIFKNNPLETGLSGLFFVLLLFPKFIALYIGVLIITITVLYIKKQIKFNFNWSSIGFILLYLAYIIGTIWTQNTKLANFYVVNKIAFILFPFLFAFTKKDFKINILFYGLIIATLLAFLRGVIGGIPCYIQHFSFPYCFMRSHLSTVIHPTYMTVFATFSLFAVYKMYLEKAIRKGFAYVLLGIFLLYILLLLSSSGLIFLFLVLGGFILKTLWNKVNRKLIVIGIPVLLLALVFIAPRTPYVKEEIKYSKAAFQEFAKSPSEFVKKLPQDPSGSKIRLLMWTVASEEISKKPLGVGTGNVDIYLGANLREKGLGKIADKEYNPHNQFLQTTLEIGMFGGIILVLIFVFGFFEAKRTRSYMMFLLFACFLLNSLFESMLQHQSAIIFFPFLFMMLLVDFNSKKLMST